MWYKANEHHEKVEQNNGFPLSSSSISEAYNILINCCGSQGGAIHILCYDGSQGGAIIGPRESFTDIRQMALPDFCAKYINEKELARPQVH